VILDSELALVHPSKQHGSAVVSGVLFIGGMVLLGQAMYLADQGDPSMMWPYIRPQPAQYLGALCCAAAAAIGWYAGGRVWRSRRRAAESAAS